ncbi:hypothetical protein [Terricaulis sp.]|uniref:hypothetical protein n=1 Tax=Terricaulis sp. TaxID=2768686 RepID=UPI00378380A8
MRQSATENAQLHFEPRRELWFAAENGVITLCRLSEDTSPLNADAGESFKFGPDGTLLDADDETGWVTAY